MKGLRSSVLVGVATASIAFGMLPASADSGAGAGAFIGNGTITPGLSTGGGAQTYTLNGTGAITLADTTTTTPVAGTITCSLTGTDSIGTPQQGAGQVNGGCSGALVPVAGTENCTLSLGSYTRILVSVSASAAISCSGPIPVNGSLTAACLFVPTRGQGLLFTFFALVCAYVLTP